MSATNVECVETLSPDDFILVDCQYEENGQIVVKGPSGRSFISSFFEVDSDDCDITVRNSEILTITPKGQSRVSFSAVKPYWRRLSELVPRVSN